jgi:TPR repeat protein
MKRVDANDAIAMGMLGSYYNHGQLGLQQDHNKAIELWTQSAHLGCSKAHISLSHEYCDLGDMKKATAAMAGHEGARHNLGCTEFESGDRERAVTVKHWTIAASAGEYMSMQNLLGEFKQGFVIRAIIVDTTLSAYNTSCAGMRSDSRETLLYV